MRLFGKLSAAVLCLNLTIAQAEAAEVTIAVLGDSLTQGYGLPDGDGLVPQLQAWLDASGATVTLINAGVSGDTTAGGLSRVDWTLSPDVQAVIVELGGNDILRGFDPSQSRKNLEGIVKAVTAKGLPVLLIGMEAPGNYGTEYKTRFDAIYPELAATYGTLLFPVYLAPILSGRSTGEALQDFMQADGIHPNKAGVAEIVKALGPLVATLAQSVR